MNKELLVKTLVFLGDLSVLQIALFCALFFRNRQLIEQFPYFFSHFISLYLLWLLILFILNVYDLHFFAKPLDFIFNIFIFFVVSIFVSATYFYFITPQFAPKTILLLDLILFCLGFFLWRVALATWIEKHFLVKVSAKEAYEKIHKKVSLENLNTLSITPKNGAVDEFIKRLIDVLVALAGLLVCVALFPIIAILILVDSKGGIFFSQKRVGKNGDVFLMYKFRTMQSENTRQQELWREKNKDTITRVGRVLRRLHLDELPQAWNMLKGDISFVGPRPEWDELAVIFEKEIPYYRYRYRVKPGIIGWAQVNFPPSQSVSQAREKFEYDLYYIKHQSLLLDLEIMFKAVKLFFF